MSRVIKFRGWNKQSHMMVDDIKVMNGRGGTVALSEFFDPDMIVLPLQFTGLTDKNGVEIYEGDIFRDENDGVWPVEWSEIYAAFVVGAGGDALFGNWKDGDNLEVIGNIMENPELVK